MAQAFAQDVVNVFNPKYKPQGSEEKDLFTLQIYYIYAIFCSNLKTDFGQKLVWDYKSSQNAQAIWKELSNDAEKSTVAQLNATNLLRYTHMAQVENWKGTTLSFILCYQEQIWLYNQLQPPNAQTSDHAMMIYLQNAVYVIEELRLVQTTGSQLTLANGRRLFKHVLKNVLKCDLTLPHYLSVLQHFQGNEDKFNVIDYFLCDQTYFNNLSYSETVIENSNEKDPTKVDTRVETYHVPNYLKARCIFFKKFLKDKKNNGEDLNYKSFYMGLTLDDFMTWKAEEMTMNTSSPCVAKSRDLVADLKKGIK
jgi:hypothetical protein